VIKHHFPARAAALPATLLATALLTLSACVVIPPDTQLIDRDGRIVDRQAACPAIAYPSASEASPIGLDAGGLGLLVWNLHRGSDPDLAMTLQGLARDYPLLALQEARLNDDLRGVLDHLQLQWDFSPGFEFNGDPVGVLSAAQAPILARCGRRVMEYWLGIPKVALYTLYPIKGARERLLLLNLHGINFSIGTKEFREQLHAARAVVEGHHGPLIVAGDFNTWSDERTRLLMDMARELGLTPVSFDDEQRLRVWDLPLDHVLYRGLRVLSATSTQQPQSDHNPLLVRFALTQEPSP
jgi:endonuclease/exonuclease/phosphatase (EEP) superfamily protein YafD